MTPRTWPKVEQLARELVRAEHAMRSTASNWRDVPTAERLRLIRAADRAERLLIRAGIRDLGGVW